MSSRIRLFKESAVAHINTVSLADIGEWTVCQERDRVFGILYWQWVEEGEERREDGSEWIGTVQVQV